VSQPVFSHLVPARPQPGTTLAPYPVVFLPPRPRVTDRSVKWLHNSIGPEVWDTLASGEFIRLLPMGGHAGNWPPQERGWLSLARPPDIPEGMLVRISVGHFRECLFTCVEEIRLCGTVFEVCYGAAGWHRTGTTHQPGQVVAYFRYARPPCLEGVNLPVRVRRWHGEWKVVS
jgi:hypothetical protein